MKPNSTQKIRKKEWCYIQSMRKCQLIPPKIIGKECPSLFSTCQTAPPKQTNSNLLQLTLSMDPIQSMQHRLHRRAHNSSFCIFDTSFVKSTMTVISVWERKKWVESWRATARAVVGTSHEFLSSSFSSLLSLFSSSSSLPSQLSLVSPYFRVNQSLATWAPFTHTTLHPHDLPSYHHL